MSARRHPADIIAESIRLFHRLEGAGRVAEIALSALTAAGYKLIGPDDAKLIQTALEHASFALDGIVALDDEDMGKDGGSATAQHTKRTVDRALKALLASRPLPLQETEK